MKLAFSTLGCTNYNYDKIRLLASEADYDAIEINILEGENYPPNSKHFLSANIEETARIICSSGLKISCLSSGVCFNDYEGKEKNIAAALDYINLASRLSIPFVRIACDSHRRPEADLDLDLLIDSLSMISIEASNKSVTVLIGTNGSFSDSSLLKDLLIILNKPQIGVCWDVHNPYRFCLESIADTYNKLKKHIRYVHLKDSRLHENRLEYCPVGEGDIPNKEALLLLKQKDFQGYVSIEWEAAWQNLFPAPETVISGFKDFVQTTIK